MTYPFHPPEHPAELLSLHVKDIDFGSNNIFVRAGKGNKDRTTKKGRQRKEVIKDLNDSLLCRKRPIKAGISA
jgi:integrase|tara:strand:- start:33 stop:251 length:219 start_codon:yes stop_codon:yes gene_type:complete